MSTTVELKQVALMVADLPRIADNVDALLGARSVHSDPEMAQVGLRNVVMPLGRHYLEIASPTIDDSHGQRFLDRRGDAGYMLILSVSDLAELDAFRTRLIAEHVRIVSDAHRKHHATISVHPQDVGTLLSVDWSAGEWITPVAQTFRPSPCIAGITEVAVSVHAPADTAARWAAILGATVESGPSLELADGCRVRFGSAPEGAPGGIASITIAAQHHELIGTTTRIGGLDVIVVEAQ